MLTLKIIAIKIIINNISLVFRLQQPPINILRRKKRHPVPRAKYVPLNSLTLSKLGLSKTGNDIRSPGTSSQDSLKQDTKYNTSSNAENATVQLSGSGNKKPSYTPWWKQFPQKTKNKNAAILNKLNQLKETVPEWPWMNAAAVKTCKCFNYYVII